MSEAADVEPRSGRWGFAALIIAVTLTLSAYFMLVALVPLTVVALGAEARTLGVLVSLSFVAPLLLAVPVGRAVDRFGPKPLLTLGAGALALAVIPAIVATSMSSITLLQAVIGLIQVAVLLSGQALAARLGPEQHRLRRVGYFSLAMSGGQLIGPPTAGVAFDAVGPEAAFAVAAMFALVACAVASTLPRREDERDAATATAGTRPTPLALLRAPSFAVAMLGSSTVLVCMGIMHAFLALRLADAPNPGTLVGALLGVMALASIAVRPFVAPITARMGGPRSALLNVALLVLVGTLLAGSTAAVPALVVAVVCIGLGSGVSQPLSIVMVLDDRPKAHHGVALGVRISGNRLAQLLGPLAVGGIATVSGVGAAITLVGAALTLPIAAARVREARRGVA